MNPDTHLSIPSQVISRLVEDEAVLLDLRSGIYFGLDGVGRRIWDCIGEGLSLGEVAAILVSEYEVAEEKAQSDVITFARELLERGLLSE